MRKVCGAEGEEKDDANKGKKDICLDDILGPLPLSGCTIEQKKECSVSDETENKDVENNEVILEVAFSLQPKILVTSSSSHTKLSLVTMKELGSLFGDYRIDRRRSKRKIKEIAEDASKEGFTSILYLNESNKKINALAIINLISRTTSYFRLSNYIPGKSIPNHAKVAYAGEYEIITKNFQTCIGHAAENMLKSIFPKIPNLQARQVVLFHNNRDYIFFRLYRYMFETDNKCKLQEMGPKFTLKLMWLQKGIFDSRSGDYVYRCKVI